MKVRFLGSGDAFGSGGRFNTCIHLEGRQASCLIDCGASSLIAMRKFGVDPNGIGAIFITHLHGDHFGGLPFVILDAQLVSRRTAPLHIAGPPGLRDRMTAAQEVLFPGSSKADRRFAIEYCELTTGVAHVVNRWKVTPYEMRHPCGAPPFALRIACEGLTICYSGDTEWTDELIPAARDADLFIAESYFFDKKIKFHLDFTTLAAHLPEIAARRVILTHMSQDMLGRAGETGLECAYDGLMMTLEPAPAACQGPA